MAKRATPRIPLFDLRLSASAKREVNRTLDSGWLSTGPRSAELEKQVARLTRTKHAVAVNSATTGLELALMAIGARPGVEVITSPFTFVATVEAILRTGAEPIFADIDPHSLNLDPDEVERKTGSKTLAIVPVDIAGLPCDYDPLVKLCNRKTIPLIADAAHSLGATYKRKSIGATADAAVHSFYATKNLTCGEGGMVVSNHKQFVEVVRKMSRHGMTTNAHDRQKTRSWDYDVRCFGAKGNLSDIHAAIGLGQLGAFEADQVKRARIAARYLKNLRGLDDMLELPPVPKGVVPAWHLFIVKLHLSQLKIDRGKFIDLMKRRGVECGVHYKALFELSFYRDHLMLESQHYPNAAYATRRVVSLPMYPSLALKDVDYVCEAVERILNRHAR